jgi:uncharacterized protein (TIGR02145 family)
MPVASVAVSPASANVKIGATQQMTAVLKDSLGGTLSGRTVTWSSSDTPKATVSSSGLVTAKATGSASITATSEQKNGIATITVYSLPVSVTDVDGNQYSIITIGSQDWLSSNLKTTRYRDGTPVPYPLTNVQWASDSIGSRVAFGHATANATVYGYLYNWHAVNTGKLCPAGWRVPTINDWSELASTLGGRDVAGGKMKAASSLWQSPNNGATDESGFGAIPGSHLRNDGIFAPLGFAFGGFFYDIRQAGYWWSSTEQDASNAKYISLYWDRTLLDTHSVLKTFGFSIRCISDASNDPSAAAQVATVSVSPATATVAVGQLQQLTAYLRNGNGEIITGRGVVWTSSDTAKATVSQTGLVNSKAQGAVTLTATSEGKAGSATISITQPNVPDGLIGFYPLNATAHNTISPDLNGTLFNIAWGRDRNGKANGAAYFYGGTSVRIPGSVLNNLPTGSFSMWVRWDSLSTYQVILAKVIGSNAATYYFTLNGCTDSNGFPTGGAEPGQVCWHSQNYTANPAYVASTGKLTPGIWSHVAVTWTSGTINIYLNGALDRSVACTGCGILNSSSTGTTIGRWSPTENIGDFRGAIDELRVYNRPLTLSEIEVIARDNNPDRILAYGPTGLWLLDITSRASASVVSAQLTPVREADLHPDGMRAVYRVPGSEVGREIRIKDGTVLNTFGMAFYPQYSSGGDSVVASTSGPNATLYRLRPSLTSSTLASSCDQARWLDADASLLCSTNTMTITNVLGGGSTAVPITKPSVWNSSEYLNCPSIARDGQTIAFYIESANMMYFVDRKGSNLKAISRANCRGAWSPREDLFAAIVTESSTSTIRIYDSNGIETARIPLPTGVSATQIGRWR